MESPNGLLPRFVPGEPAIYGDGDGAFVPWAITPLGKVVYARFGEDRARPNAGGLRLYDGFVSQDRRRLAESALGLYALNLPALTKSALDHVTGELLAYIDRLIYTRTTTPKAFKQAVYDGIGHYYYTNGGQGFGRISELDKKVVGVDRVYQGIMGALKSGRVDQRVGLHETFCRKVLFDSAKGVNFGPGDPVRKTYESYGPVLRQDWFDDKNKRGRLDIPKAQQPGSNTFGGVMTTQQGLSDVVGGNVGQTAVPRARGVDMFARDVNRTREPAADDYYDDLDTRNLLFGAGISGTTGTCLQAALAFSQNGGLTGERLKQYVFAIIGYLVGGGMHSFHESLAVARKVGMPYFPGKYIPSLPDSFLAAAEFRNWRAEYYDIAILGAIHWRAQPWRSAVAPQSCAEGRDLAALRRAFQRRGVLSDAVWSAPSHPPRSPSAAPGSLALAAEQKRRDVGDAGGF